MNGSAQVPTTFMGVMGFKNITVSGSSTAKWGSTRLRVALVLDNTGSMADAGKITALKSATKNLLAQFKAAAGTNGDVYVSIIPFSKDVNVGSGNYNRQLDRLGRLEGGQRQLAERQRLAAAGGGGCGWGWSNRPGPRQPQYVERLHHRPRQDQVPGPTTTTTSGAAIPTRAKPRRCSRPSSTAAARWR